MNRRALIFGAAACAFAAPARAQGADPRFAAGALYSAERGGAAYVVARNGVVLFEHYPAGFARAARWPIGKATRAFAALLAAALVKDGLMSFDEPVSMTLGDWGAHPVKQNISLRLLLQGASGVVFGPRDARDAASALALEPVDQPGVRYSDDPAPFVLFAEIARRKLAGASLGPDPAAYLNARAIEPLGGGPAQWSRGPDGAARFDDGASVSARCWAQVGELIRREGVWRGQELVDAGALREATRGSFAEARAGVGVWLAAPGAGAGRPAGSNSDLWRMSPPAPSDLVMAAGEAGQRLYVIGSRRIIAARLVRDEAVRAWSDAAFLALLLRDA